ncbi:Glycosyl transferase [Cinnamomum micranthum f. kanehirae]|uniref:Glycosyl transferase n=1 Tax=Cinnamomum micranthum f. kanehirae TaxID=337451 RepID=A0A443PQB0_9MAGN|nr:Glycosyl transferase [Cinnamomum micranthum f. kanehirae]
MKPLMRSRVDEGEGDKLSGTSSKDWSIGLVKVVSFLVIFVAGIVIGLSVSAHGVRNFSSRTELFFPTPNYPPVCENKDCLSIWSFINPGQLTHEMTDEEIFWRASMVPRKEEYPYKRVPKVAFLFLTRGPLPLAPLWDRFFHGHEELYSVYVHAPPGYKLDVSETSAFYGRQIPSQDVKWGTFTLTDAERRLLANALLDFSNERFVLLSESCIPIYDFLTVYRYLIGSIHSFVESYDEPTRYGRGRYSRHMFPDIKLHQWRKGSQWFELNRSLAVNIVADTKYYTLFRKYCKPSCYPDEHYLPTYLNMFYEPLNSNRTVTWVDWSKRDPHPATFGAANITEDFIQSIRYNGTSCLYNSGQTNICFLFARKFAPSALEPLLNLTSTVMKF